MVNQLDVKKESEIDLGFIDERQLKISESKDVMDAFELEIEKLAKRTPVDTELISLEEEDELEVSAFVDIDPIGDLSEEELDQPIGKSYWTARRIEEFNFRFMKFHLKKLFNPHSSKNTKQSILDWIFKYPLYKKTENIRLFSFQHLAIMCKVCPHEYRREINTMLVQRGVYETLEKKVNINRSPRSISLTYGTSEEDKKKVHKAMLKRWIDGQLPSIKSEAALSRLVEKNFRCRQKTLQVTGDLFSKDNVRKTARSNGDGW